LLTTQSSLHSSKLCESVDLVRLAAELLRQHLILVCPNTLIESFSTISLQSFAKLIHRSFPING
jgi:hypothetical protein